MHGFPFPLIMMFFCHVRSQGTNIRVRADVLLSHVYAGTANAERGSSNGDAMRHGNLRQEPTNSDIPNQISLSLLFLCRTCSFNLRPYGDLIMQTHQVRQASGHQAIRTKDGCHGCAMHKGMEIPKPAFGNVNERQKKEKAQGRIFVEIRKLRKTSKKKKGDAASLRRPPHQLYTRVTP
jgi:hypothetical protein